MSSGGEMLDELEWPSLEALPASLSQDSLWCSDSIEKDKYLTPAHRLKTYFSLL